MTVHKASPDPDYPHSCIFCQSDIKRVPGGSGPVWVHADTGAVAGPDRDNIVRGQE